MNHIKMEQTTTDMPIHIPPIIGEYGYYDPRNMTKHWVINVAEKKDHKYGCVYSSPVRRTYKYFITCQGIITNVLCEVNDSNIKLKNN